SRNSCAHLSGTASQSESRRVALEIARNRPGTQASKAIVAYEESRELTNLVPALEEISKNSDYSTDLRIPLGYYIDELDRHYFGPRANGQRSGLGPAASCIQYLGKIYGDRVEYMYQVACNQVESLGSAERPKPLDGPETGAAKPEEPRKRRAKNLTKKEVDPYLVTMEPRKFKAMSDDKRFSLEGFAKYQKKRTCEYLYQDHVSPNLWRNATIMDPENPYDTDDKKNYKLFTYFVEHRYNTLLPDIPFERLNLIKEYVATHQLNPAEILSAHLNSKEYLDEYIALENQMLAARYGATVRSPKLGQFAGELAKRAPSEVEPTDPKRARLEGDADESLPMDTSDLLQNQVSIDSGMGDITLNETREDSRDSCIHEESTFNESQVENPPLSSTLDISDSSVLHSTQIDLPPAIESAHTEDPLPIDSGIGMEDVFCDTHLHTGQSFDDEGVVLSDIEDHRLLSPKVMVKDILPGVPNKDSVSVLVDEEMRALSGINEPVDPPIVEPPAEVEVVNVPREVCYPIEHNILEIAKKHLRKTVLFKLPKDYNAFKNNRQSRREAVPKTPATRRVINLPLPNRENAIADDVGPASPLSLEFDHDNSKPIILQHVSTLLFCVLLTFVCPCINFIDFLGFRRVTLDSGFDIDTIRAWSANVSTIGEPPPMIAEAGAGNVEVVREVHEAEAAPNPVDEPVPKDGANPDPSAMETDNREAQLVTDAVGDASAVVGEDSGLGTTAFSELDATQPLESADNTAIDDKAPADKPSADQTDEGDDTVTDIARSVSPPTEDDILNTSAMVGGWQMYLAPILESSHFRQDFNIKDLGTEILDLCQSRGGSITLQDVMRGKDPTYLCRYMLAALLLVSKLPKTNYIQILTGALQINHGNVKMNQGTTRDKSQPLSPSQFGITLLSMQRKEIHPEDDIGALRPREKEVKPVKVLGKHKSSEVPDPEASAKNVRVIQPIPKLLPLPSDDDSGISSMLSSTSLCD
ncbi:hypothetical protein KR018_012378, partial [Drosophila ironensis]